MEFASLEALLDHIQYLYENDELIAMSVSTVEEGRKLGSYTCISDKFGALVGAMECTKHDLLQLAHAE